MRGISLNTRRWIKKIVTCTVIAIAIISQHMGFTEIRANEEDVKTQVYSPSLRRISYSDYIEKYSNKPRPQEEIIVDAVTYHISDEIEPDKLENFNGSEKTSIKTRDEGYVEWIIDVPSEGLYNIGVKYYPVPGKSSAIEREIWINGEVPFEGARSILFPRIWTNGTPIIQDDTGNEYRPIQIEAPEWTEVALSGTIGFYDDSYEFYFDKGENTIRFVSVREPMVIESIRLYREKPVKTYKEIILEYEEKGYDTAGKDLEPIVLQGQDAIRKSDPTLYPVWDRTSPLTYPSSVSKIRLNTIGGINWRYPKQWLEWEFDVETPGLYSIIMRGKQNFKSGIFVSRRIYINGKIPFEEAGRVRVNYSMRWQIIDLGEDEEEYLFYFDEGKNTLRMEVVQGDLGEILRETENSVLELNYIYRKIRMITGTVPDPFRDYQLVKRIPEITEIFQRQRDVLQGISNKLEEITGQQGEESVHMQRMSVQLDGFLKDPDTIPERMDRFNSNISALGMWLLTSSEQPLLIDYISIRPPSTPLPPADAPWWQRFIHEIRAFIASFFEDYNQIGNTNDIEEAKRVSLWMGAIQGGAIGQGGGRDQAEVMKSLIDNFFTQESGIVVDLRLIDMSVLLRAVAVGNGPDLAIYQDQSIPVNYALRSALKDLTEFEDIDSVLERFAPSAIEPFKIGDSIYALPEQQWFDMMFYRKDVLEEIGVKPPDTWDDFYAILPVLQRNYMDIGLPSPVNIVAGGPLNSVYMMLLYQMDGDVYDSERRKCILDNETGIQAFTKWTELYTKYKLPLRMDILTRFRVGEAPIVIAPYTFYNALSIASPEIRGLWEMSPVPGLKMDDGTIRREVSSYVTGTIMFENARDPQTAWEYMKWWTRSDTQVAYGREMEALLGPSARWPTANLDAMWELPWPTKDANSIREQWQWVRAVPEVPGGYYTGRNVDNAIRTVINQGMNPRETLLDFVELINDEILIKRREFGLE